MQKYLFKVFSLLLFIPIFINSQLLQSDVPWNDDETGYYTIKNNNIVLVSATGDDDKIILPALKTKNLKIESFVFSTSKNKVLLFTNSVKFGDIEPEETILFMIFKKKIFTKLVKIFLILALCLRNFPQTKIM